MNFCQNSILKKKQKERKDFTIGPDIKLDYFKHTDNNYKNTIATIAVLFFLFVFIVTLLRKIFLN